MPENSAKSRCTWRLFGVAALIAIGALMAIWMKPQKALPSRGGLYFPGRLVVPVPAFAQGDPRWAENPLGSTPATLHAEGCAVASAAMVLASYGIDVDPGRLNRFLTTHDGFTPQGWLDWDKAAEIALGRCEKAYESAPSHGLMDWNLLRGNPVIVRIRFPSGTTHFVVVAGKEGWDYLIRDPGAGAARGLYPLSELASQIEALRYYRKIR